MTLKKLVAAISVFSIIGALIAMAAYSENRLHFLAFLHGKHFLSVTMVSFAILFLLLILKLIIRKPVLQDWTKIIGGIIFLPVLLLPAFRCWFKVPYVFCRVCPQKCPWGMVRTLALGSFVALNLSGRYWCLSACPFCTYQECQAQISKKRSGLFSWIAMPSYIILSIVLGLYLMTLLGSDFIRNFEYSHYTWSGIAVLAVSAIIVTAFFVPKYFCRYLCPVGTVAEITSKIMKKVMGR